MLTFTGSPAVGWPLKAKAGQKKVVLELGGNVGVIVHSDADLNYAAERILSGGFSYAGQSCISVQRVFVQHSCYQAFLDIFLPKVKALVLGDPLDEATDVGPMIDSGAAVRTEEWIKEAVAGGAKVLTGGKRKGTLFEPTILVDTLPEMKTCALEIFAPVVAVMPYNTFEEAVAAVDDSLYGLQAGVFTRDLGNIWYAFTELEVGGVIVNDVPTWRVDHMPYGGMKNSGFGREGVRYAMEEMTEPKLLVLNHLGMVGTR